jgi:hypothetical protein
MHPIAYLMIHIHMLPGYFSFSGLYYTVLSVPYIGRIMEIEMPPGNV